MGLCFLWFYVQELSKAQPAVVLVLKRLRRRGNGLKSYPTDWEKPAIEFATPGLQDIGLSPTPRPPPVIHNFKFVTFNCIAINLLSTDQQFFNSALMLVICAETSFERIF